MFWLYLAVPIIAGLGLFTFLLYVWVSWMAKREPFGAFIRLRTRRKLDFFRLLMLDKRVPLYVKAVPVGVVVYLSIPFDIIPDFIPVLGYLDDVGVVLLALALMLRLTPRPVIDDLFQRALARDSDG